MTVQELIEMLECLNPDAEVRLAMQPSWPFEYSIDTVSEAIGDDEHQVVYIAEGSQLDYLSGEACNVLGW